MIELNCSYEESKKILELGYNFRRVCKDFYKQGECSLYKFTEAGGRMVLEVQIKLNRAVGGDGKLIPIIPKAALEACLPDYQRYEDKHTWAGHTSICLAYGTGEDLTIENYTTEYESAFEAFMWCHEHYPEELKKKFEEVMK